ncbi:hypothetical protein BgiMline_030818 [Biomphalaria glabrata]|uniref:Uncharacterized protein LOC106074963 n=1 Tax=Biomphalaria glabrata TaxID=6526 RepID=A0A9U8EL08_BIOGL|nr:uncharacterized protein LOC106074963 [Biomphalaria glabrata]XP_013091323.2 uncharacterized protein LOC106074963 [Biomphalaria glabrata]KAI8734773.1 hypothetical protein BgiMline_028087 [Biomphalaria glabrata]
MAEKARQSPWIGEADVQFSQNEADLHKHRNDCKKNKSHANFIPINAFTLQHLPEDYRDKDIFDFIKMTAELTVRISTNYVSHKRPEVMPHTTTPYLFWNKRGEYSMASGTGRVCDVKMKSDPRASDDEMYEDLKAVEELTDLKRIYETCDESDKPHEESGWVKVVPPRHCLCENCKQSKEPSREFGWVKIITARHVIFNNKEAENATCRIFFDENECPKTLIYGVKMATLNKPNFDWCWLKCITCDLDLLSKLKDLCDQREELYRKINDRYVKERGGCRLNVIVSHPHGCSKQVSVGEWLDVKLEDDGAWTQYHYNTATCPGSSGATVIMLGYTGTDDHVHSGGSKDFNYSGVGDDYWKVNTL